MMCGRFWGREPTRIGDMVVTGGALAVTPKYEVFILQCVEWLGDLDSNQD